MDIGQKLMSGFPTLSTGNVADAGKTDVKIMDAGIKPLHHHMKMAGPAFTVDTPADSNLSVFEAIAMAPAGSVLVVNAHGNMTTGHVGDLMALAAQVRGLVGIIVDGAVRDIEDIITMRYPVFARGGYPHGNAPHPGKINQPVRCGGIQVNPGDMIFGDATGVLAFPASKAELIYKQATVIANSELGFVQQLNEGKTLLQMPEFLKMHKITPSAS